MFKLIKKLFGFGKKETKDKYNLELEQELKKIDQEIEDSVIEEEAVQQLIKELDDCGSYEDLANKKHEIESAINSMIDTEDIQATLQFIIGKKDIQIMYTYDLSSDESAETLAKFLFRLNDGRYQEDIAALMLKNSMKSVKDGLFIKKVFEKWSNFTSDEQDAPAVSPLDFT